MKFKPSQKGFAAVEAILIVIIVGLLVGVGYYVWHANQQAKATLNAASKDASSLPAKVTKNSSATTPSQTYFTIKEWSVRAPYSGSLHLLYKINNNGGSPVIYTASVTASELGGSGACVSGGGIIERAYADTVLDGAGTTASQVNSPYTTTKIGSFYYVYIHPQGSCTDNTTVENQTYNDVQALVKGLQSY